VNPDVRSFLAEYVPAGLAGKVAAVVRPCVHGRTDRCAEDRISLGRSKFAGRPDVPAGFEWPITRDGPCWFVAQVDLADLRAFETGYRLPPKGLLSFFYHDSQGTVGPRSRVYYFPPGRLRRVEVVVDPRYGGQAFHDSHLYPRSLRLAQGYCLPPGLDQFGLTKREMARSGWDVDEMLNVKESFHARFARETHRLFGHPKFLKAPRGYQQVATFGEVMDRYYYFVPESCVEALDFRKLRVIYECS
jgi:Domain of unknown function (DUF1963)